VERLRPAHLRYRQRGLGVDSLTYALYFHWSITHDRAVRPTMTRLDSTAVSYSPATNAASDVPVWDSIADTREYQVTGSPQAMAKAEAAFRFVAVEKASSFALGACPAVDYRQPGGAGTKLKTLESGLELHQGRPAPLLGHHEPRVSAGSGGGVRGGPQVLPLPGRPALHRVRVRQRIVLHPGARPVLRLGERQHDLGRSRPGRATGAMSHFGQAVATARAVQRHLGDATGVYADLRAENDVTQP
jgi:hypothetical protein